MFYLPEIFLQCSANGTSEMIMKHDPNIPRRPPVQSKWQTSFTTQAISQKTEKSMLMTYLYDDGPDFNVIGLFKSH